MRTTLRRLTVVGTVLAAGVATAGCGSDDASAGGTETVTAQATAGDVATDSMVGLEVTAVGNVMDVLSDDAMRLDRDGLGSPEDTAPQDAQLDYGYYDYDFYDYDDLTENDGDFDDEDAADTGVLVVSAFGLGDHEVDDAVRVSGTVRRFDQDTIESVYDIDLPDDTFDQYEDSLVIVADSIEDANAAGSGGSGSSDSASSDSSASPSSDDSASPSASPSS